MPGPIRPPTVREYFLMVGKLWGEEISGPILAFVSIVLIIAYAHYADNANATANLVKYSAWLTGIISVLLIFVAQYKAWCSERIALNAEKVRQIGGDIQGAVTRGYLDLRTFPDAKPKGWVDLTQGCSVKLYIEAANRNDWGTWFRPPKTKLELRIGKECFCGVWEHITPDDLAVRDDSLEDRRLHDLFDPMGTNHPLQHGFPWTGYLGFLLPDFDRSLLEAKTDISATMIKILMEDTLDKVHTIETNDVKLLIGRLCLATELGSQ